VDSTVSPVGYRCNPSDLTPLQWAEQTISWSTQYISGLNLFNLQAADRTLELMRESAQRQQDTPGDQ